MTMQQTIRELGLEPRTDAQCASMIGLSLKQAFTDLIPMTDAIGDPVFRHLSPDIQ